MEKKEFLNVAGIAPTKELLDNPKIKQIVDFVNKHGFILYDTDAYIKPEVFNTLIDYIHSAEAIIQILNRESEATSLNTHLDSIIKFYNLYDPYKVQWLGKDTAILVDEEYLKNSTKEWTENVLFKSNKIIFVGQKRVTIRENRYSKDEPKYIEPIELNVTALRVAKERGMLKQAILQATEIM